MPFNETDTRVPGCSLQVDLIKMGEGIRAQRRHQNEGGSFSEKLLASQPGVKASFLHMLVGENLSKYMMNFMIEFPHVSTQVAHNNVV